MQMKKLYLSMSQSRMLSSEFPIGDPFGGAAYGKREAPVIGIAMMYGAATTAVTGVLSAIAVGATMVSGFLTTVGSLSGNEKAMKLGSQIGILGGAAGLANWATSGAAAAATPAAEAAAGSATSGATPTVAAEMANASSGVEAVNSFDSGAMASSMSGADAAGSAAGAANSFDSGAMASAMDGGSQSLAADSALGGFSDAPTAAPGGPAYAGSGIDTVGPDKSWLDSYMQFAKDNPKVSEQGFGLVSGIANAYSDERKTDAQKEIYGARNALEAERLALEKAELARRERNKNNISQLQRFAGRPTPAGIVAPNMRTA